MCTLPPAAHIPGQVFVPLADPLAHPPPPPPPHQPTCNAPYLSYTVASTADPLPPCLRRRLPKDGSMPSSLGEGVPIYFAEPAYELSCGSQVGRSFLFEQVLFFIPAHWDGPVKAPPCGWHRPVDGPRPCFYQAGHLQQGDCVFQMSCYSTACLLTNDMSRTPQRCPCTGTKAESLALPPPAPQQGTL